MPFIIILLFLSILPMTVRANCNTPPPFTTETGSAATGVVMRDPTTSTEYLCDGTNWVNMGLAERICSGETAPGQGWVAYNGPHDTKYIDIDASSCGFTSTPRYFANMRFTGPNGATYTTTGTHAIYVPTSTSFRLYVSYAPWLENHGRTQNSNYHDDYQWYIEWVAIGQ